jgi:hypothetical protein
MLSSRTRGDTTEPHGTLQRLLGARYNWETFWLRREGCPRCSIRGIYPVQRAIGLKLDHNAIVGNSLAPVGRLQTPEGISRESIGSNDIVE